MDSTLNNDTSYSTPTDSPRRRFINKHAWLELISNAAIPLMIGVITLWIAIHQQQIAQTNRDKDAMEIAEQRKQDIELARLQREEDKETARLQRELDWNMTNDKRIQDYELAEKERNISEQQRAREFDIAHWRHINDRNLEDDLQKESVLDEHQDDLATLLLDYELLRKVSNSTWWFILQMKTGAALRQLDPARRTILIHTLLEAEVLDVHVNYEQSILYRSNLSGVEFGQLLDTYDTESCIQYEHLNAADADIRYASFHGVCLYNSPTFAYSNLDYTDWSFANLYYVYFGEQVSLNEARFAGAVLIGVRFNKTVVMNQVSFQYNFECKYCQFVKTSLLRARLDHSNFFQTTFSSLSIADGNMSYGLFDKSIFEGVTLDRVDLSGANLNRCNFTAVSMINCSLIGTLLHQTLFSGVTLLGCIGLTNQQISVISNLYKTTLPNGTFIEGKQV